MVRRLRKNWLSAWETSSAWTCAARRTLLKTYETIDSIAERLESITGIVHLAAVSRIALGEQDPELCWSVNVEGTRRVLEVAARLPRRPWVVYASSREVYGEPENLPVREDAIVSPLNAYARSKVEAEALITEARSAGMRACVVRFSNVYGDVHDYRDRVVPAFAAAAATGGVIRVEGGSNTFDFTHVDDVVGGLSSVIALLNKGQSAPPPIHFVTGQGTTLDELASLALGLGVPRAHVVNAPARAFGVRRFTGDPGARSRDSWMGGSHHVE